MADVKDGHRTPGASPGGPGNEASSTQLGYPDQDNNVNTSDTAPNWEEQFNKQRKINRQLEERKNELMRELEQVKSSQNPATKNAVDAKIDALTDTVSKFMTRFDAMEKENYVKEAVTSRGLPEAMVDELKDLAPDKVDALLAHIPVPKKPVTKPDSASVTGATDSPPGSKRTYTAADLKTMSREDRLKAYEAGLIVDAEGNSITKQ